MGKIDKIIELITYVDKKIQKLKRAHDEYHEWSELREELQAYLATLQKEKEVR